VHRSYSRKVDICWFRTRACKYNVRVLGSYFECDGVKYYLPTSTFLGDYGNDRSSKKLKPNFAAKYGLHHTREHTWPIGNERLVHDVHKQRFQDSNTWLHAKSLSLFQVIKHLNQVHLEILSYSVETWLHTRWQSILLKRKAVNSPFIRILIPLHVHTASIFYWSSGFSSVV